MKKGKSGKGSGKHDKTKPPVDWEARERARKERASGPGTGAFTAALFPETDAGLYYLLRFIRDGLVGLDK